MRTLTEWALHWNVPADALRDLIETYEALPVVGPGTTEADVQANARRHATHIGGRLWRNNLGAGKLDNGSFLRWGLCNDSKALNAHMKSADLIGIKPRLIGDADVGTLIGQFWSVECKAPGWTPHANNPRDQAQQRWAIMVQSLGGLAQITKGETT